MAAPRLSVQLYSVREHLEDDLDGTLGRIAALGFDAVEPFNVLDGSLGAALRRHGLEAPSAQFPFLSDDIDFLGTRVQLPTAEVVFDAAASLGVDVLVDPMVEASRWRSAEEVDRTADRLNAAAEEAAAFGLRVGYHNHSFEFHATFDGITAYEHFATSLDERIVLELDLYWAAAARQDVPALVHRLGTQLRALHVKDGAVPMDPFAEPGGYEPTALDQRPAGQGELAVSDVLAAARFVELDVVEFDHVDGDVFEAIEASADHIRQVRCR